VRRVRCQTNLIGWSQPFGAFSPTANDAHVMVVQPRQDWDGYNDPGPLNCPT
jgi:hypothetical protein